MAQSINLNSKAAIYIRVSTQFQIDKDSMQVQKRELTAYAELVLGIHDHEVFEDPGYSGKDTSRPAYQRMMARLRTGEFSHLLVWKIDRISRNLLDFAQMYAELRQIGVTFVSKNEQFDTSTAIGEAMLKIILVFAELERKMTAERVTAVMLSRANNGQWNGGRVPYGYDWDRDSKCFTVNEKEADVYRFICTLYEREQSLVRVCDELNSRGITTKTGGPWNPTGVHKLLTNVFYKGIYRYNVHSDGKGVKRRDSSEWIDIENHHPALIDEERFDRIAFRLRRNVRKGPKQGDSYSGKAVHIFSGLLRCGMCGANMTATQDRRRADGYRPSMYGCASRRRSKECTNKYVNDLAIAPDVFAAVSGVLSAVGDGSPDAIAERILPRMKGVKRIEGLDGFAEAIRNGASGMEYRLAAADDPGEDIRGLKERKKKCEASLRRLQSLYLYGSGGIAEKDYLVERKRILDELEELDGLLQDASGGDEPLMEMPTQDDRAKASYILMVDRLLSGKEPDVGMLLRRMDPAVPKAFLNRIIGHIDVLDGHVERIVFKSGLSMKFIRE